MSIEDDALPEGVEQSDGIVKEITFENVHPLFCTDIPKDKIPCKFLDADAVLDTEPRWKPETKIDLVKSGTYLRYYYIKRMQADYIASIIPQHKTFVEVFGGNGAVLMCKNRAGAVCEVYNDIDDELINLMMTLRNTPHLFMKIIRTLPYSRTIHDLFQKQLVSEQQGNSIREIGMCERAARFFYVVSTSCYGKRDHMFNGQHSVDRTEDFNIMLANLRPLIRRLQSVIIENLDYPRVLSKYDSPDTVFYVDPPSPLSDSASEFCISRRWKDDDIKKLSDLLKQVKGKVILNHPIKIFLKKLYPEHTWKYTEYQLRDMPDKEVLVCNFAIEGDIFSTLRKLKECGDEYKEELASIRRGEEVEAANANVRGNTNPNPSVNPVESAASVPSTTSSGEKVGDTSITENLTQNKEKQA